MKKTQCIGKSYGTNKTKMKTYNTREAKRIAQKNGWIYVRSKGSHHIYRHPNNPKILTISNNLNRMVWERLVNEYHLNLNV